jgi:hypothetical protein
MMAVSICSPVRMTASNDTIPLTGARHVEHGSKLHGKILETGPKPRRSAALVRCNRRFSPAV